MVYVNDTAVPLTGGWDELDLKGRISFLIFDNMTSAQPLQWSYNGTDIDGQLAAAEKSPVFNVKRFNPTKVWVKGTIGESYGVIGIP